MDKDQVSSYKWHHYVLIFVEKINITKINVAGAFMYFYRPGDRVDPQGGGITIPLPPELGQYDLSMCYKNLYS